MFIILLCLLSMQTALHWAAVKGNLSAMEILIRGGGEIQTVDSKGYTVSETFSEHSVSIQ
jgi:ankyrin repeat protein